MTACSALITARLLAAARTTAPRAPEVVDLPDRLAAVLIPGPRRELEGVPDGPPSPEELRRRAAARSRDRHGGRRLLPSRPAS